jgi:hypothetical protein
LVFREEFFGEKETENQSQLKTVPEPESKLELEPTLKPFFLPAYGK